VGKWLGKSSTDLLGRKPIELPKVFSRKFAKEIGNISTDSTVIIVG